MAEATAEPIIDTPSAPAPTSGYASVTHDGVTVDSNTETEAEIRAGLAGSDAPPAEIDPPAGMERDAATGQFVAKAAKPRHDPQARIDQITAKQREAERRAETAERELAALRRPPDPVKPTATPADDWKRYKSLPDAPKLEAFDTIEDYTMAVSDFIATKRADERDAARSQQQQQQQTDRERQTFDGQWFERLNKAKAADPTLESRVDPKTPLSWPMIDAIKASDVGVELLVYLSDHQDEAQRLSTLHPRDSLRQLGRLEAQLEAASSGTAPVVPAVSHAKPPKTPLGSSPVLNAESEPGDDATDDQWYAWHQKQQRRKA